MRALCKVLGVDRPRPAPSAASPSLRCWSCASRTGFPVRAGGSRAALRATTMRGRGRGRRPSASSTGCSVRRSTIGDTEAKRATMSDKATTAAQARTFTVVEDDDGIRLDRWFKRHLPDVSFNIVSRWARTGQLRLDGKRAVPGDRVEAGQQIRVPPPDAAPGPLAAREARGQSADRGRGRAGPRDGDLRGSARVRPRQAAGPRDAGRDQDPPASRPAARRPGR